MSSPASVQGTNDSSVLSKCSMVKMGYVDDPFIRCFVSKEVRRAPLINRGYYVRCKAIQMILNQFIETTLKSNDYIQVQIEEKLECVLETKRIVSLGSGFDSLYFKIASNKNYSSKITVFEVDFPEVISRKLSLINANEKLRNLLIKKNVQNNQTSENEIVSEGVVLNTSHYKLLGVDLCKISKLETFLTESGLVFRDVPTLLLSECAITYMDVQSSDNLIRWASSKFSNAVFACYEQILPMDGFGQVMCNHFKTLNSSLRSIESFPNINSHLLRYKNLGWSSCDVMDMNTFYEKCIELEERQKIDKLELFEEFEEFHLKCGHYILICATIGQTKWKPFPNSHVETILPSCNRTVLLRQLEGCGKLNRFGHRSAFVNGLILSVGGFGVSTGDCHQRLNDVIISDLSNEKDCTLLQDTENCLKEGRLFSSLTPLSNGRLVLIGGRTSPLKPCAGIVLIDLKFVSSSITENMKVFVTVVVSEGQELRWKHTATTVVIKGQEYILIFGGRNKKEPVMGDCQLLSTNTWKWTIVDSSGSMPSARHSHSACSWTNTRTVISGGLDENLRPLNGIFVFDGEEMKWSSLETSTLLPRYSHTSHIFKDKLILLGGVNTSACPSAELAIIDLITGYSFEIKLAVTMEPLLFIKHSSILDETKEEITILGGGGTCFSFGTYFNRSAFVINLNEIHKFD